MSAADRVTAIFFSSAACGAMAAAAGISTSP